MWKNTPIAHPDDGGQPDGLHWMMLDEDAKYSYVRGFVEGLFQGHCFTTWGAPGLESKDPRHSGAIRSFDFHWDKFLAKQTYGKFVEGLNKFYVSTLTDPLPLHVPRRTVNLFPINVNWLAMLVLVLWYMLALKVGLQVPVSPACPVAVAEGSFV
jgi:hypothetical protein